MSAVPNADPWIHHVVFAAAQELARVSNLSTVDVAAVRLWLDKMVRPDTPSNVMAGFDQGVGATFFDLNSLQVLHTTQNVHGTRLGAQLRHTTQAHNTNQNVHGARLGAQLRHTSQAHNTNQNVHGARLGAQLRHTSQAHNSGCVWCYRCMIMQACRTNCCVVSDH